VRGLVLAALVMGFVSPGYAQTTLRIATLAPEGTMWARVMHEWERTLKESSASVRVKVYLGGVAGDEVAVGERIRRGQLDGLISAGTLCQQVAPSVRVLKVVGLFQGRDEAEYVLKHLKPVFDKEAAGNGFVNLAEGSVGSIIVFSRKPIASMAELRRTPLWTGRQDDFTLAQLNAIGMHAVPLPLDAASGEYRSGHLDGFLTVPSVALSWQWSSQVGYFTDLRLSFLFSCLLISNASFDALSFETQQTFRNVATHMVARIDELGRQQDEALVNELFAKQGLKQVRVDERFRSEFFEAAQESRERLSDKLVPAELVRSVVGMLADYRAQHR
jgi:TRAP-type C4-dicarboxylate transport system substrate-binding protein